VKLSLARFLELSERISLPNAGGRRRQPRVLFSPLIGLGEVAELGFLAGRVGMGEDGYMRMIWRAVIFVAGLSLLGGCASVSLSKREWRDAEPEAPEKIFVRPFAVEQEVLRVDREGETLADFEQKFAADFARRLAERLSKHVAPAEVAPANGVISGKNVWVVEGRFTRLNQGSRALRAFVGFGLGGTKTEAQVVVLRPGKRGRMERVAEFETTGGSNAEPGALFGGPFGAVPRLATQVAASGLSADARRTARMIVAAISEKLHERGERLAGKPLRAKPLGGFPEER